MTARSPSVRPIVVVVFDGVQSLDLTGPLEVFAGAETYRQVHHGPRPRRT